VNSWKNADEWDAWVTRPPACPSLYLPKLSAEGEKLVFQNPTRAVKTVILLRERGSEAAQAVDNAILAIGRIDPNVEVKVIDFSDYPGYRPASELEGVMSADTEAGLRDMKVRVELYKEGKHVRTLVEGQADAIDVTPFARDAFWVLKDVNAPPGKAHRLLQTPHHELGFYPVAPVLAPHLSDIVESRAWSSVSYETRNYGGNFLPLTDKIVLTGKVEGGADSPGAAQQIQVELERSGGKVIEVGLKNLPTGHVDEYFSVVPDPKSPCGVALLFADPSLATDPKARNASNQETRISVLAAVEKIRKESGCEPLRAFGVPVVFPSDGEGPGSRGNPVNALVFPLGPGKTQVLMASTPEDEGVRDALLKAGKELGYSLLPVFTDARGFYRRGGNVHCATNEIRE